MTISKAAVEAAALAIYSDAKTPTMYDAERFAIAALQAAAPFMQGNKDEWIAQAAKMEAERDNLLRAGTFNEGIEAAAKVADTYPTASAQACAAAIRKLMKP
jgi:hypothetical protein